MIRLVNLLSVSLVVLMNGGLIQDVFVFVPLTHRHAARLPPTTQGQASSTQLPAMHT